MTTFARAVVGVQSLPILIGGYRALVLPAAATATGEVLESAPPLALHLVGILYFTLGSILLTTAAQGSPSTVRLVLGAMIPTKVLATAYFQSDGFPAVAVWEALSGVLFSVIVLKRW